MGFFKKIFLAVGIEGLKLVAARGARLRLWCGRDSRHVFGRHEEWGSSLNGLLAVNGSGERVLFNLRLYRRIYLSCANCDGIVTFTKKVIIPVTKLLACVLL